MKPGRPTKYSPAIIDTINTYLAEATPENMEIPTVEGIALKLGVNKDTLYAWAKDPDKTAFSDALERLKMTQKQTLIKTGIFGGKEINATIIALLLRVNHDMIETQRTELTGKDGERLSVALVHDYIHVPELSSTPSPSETSPQGQIEIQSPHLAPTSEKDINSAGEDSPRSA